MAWTCGLVWASGASVASNAGAAGAAPEGSRPGRLVVELDGGETFTADVVVVGIGVVPTTDWLAGSGLTDRQRRGL